MTSAYFVPLVFLPDVITGPGEYVTRKGEVVSISSVSAPHRHDFGCWGRYSDNTIERFHKSGRTSASQLSRNDIVGPAELTA